MVASEGLSRDDIHQALSGFIHHTTDCITSAVPQGALALEITVACTGRVAEVDVLSNPGWPEQEARCVAEVLRYTPFPAHALPNGDTFTYPLSFSD